MKVFILSLLCFILAFNLPAEKIMDLPDVKKAHFVNVDGDDIFIGDQNSNFIHVYSLETHKLKFKLGGKGEGPGEFRYLPDITYISPDYIIATNRGKYIWFSRDGKIIQEKIFPTIYGMTPLKDHYVAIYITTDKMNATIVNKALCLVNSKFEKGKDLFLYKGDGGRMMPNDPPTREIPLLRNWFKFFCHDDKLFIVDSHRGFFIDVLDSNGDPLYSIDKNNEIELIKVPEDYKKRALEELRLSYKDIWDRYHKSSFTFFKYFLPMRSIWIDDKKIYVPTYKEKENKLELIVLDLKGKILDRLFVPFESMKNQLIFGAVSLFTVHKDILYELIDNEVTSTWELHKTDLSAVKK